MTQSARNLRPALTLLILGCALLLCFGLMSTVFGVPGILTAVIFSCFLIVLASAIGCAINIHAIETAAELKEINEIRGAVDEHIQLINSLVLDGRRRLDECQRLLEQNGEEAAKVKNLLIAKRIIAALEIRLNKLLALLASEDSHQLEIATELSELPLVVPEDKLAPSGSGDRIPDLHAEHWSDTLQTLLTQTERDIQSRSLAA